ncbi:CobW family GTP-binding protein [Fundicoccus culcitae]|uniref:GTP-binding protein n=1 Tax=Fundicoccus culcitae TaxID=2969821 RepID=A0ABY5P923_9LACT|nr:GTP-binding protein [Fundicoccus culcitae]UUX34923.1 GTP-binding protein [Fundicoccus culcitae]
MNQIPVTVLIGFLGSGKTTLLNRLIEQSPNERIVVIINEFGDTGIDHDLVLENYDEQIYQMNNGCMCCILRQDLVEMFMGILNAQAKHDLQIDRIIIETSGLAEPSPIAQTIIRSNVLSEQLIIDSIITLVDTENFLYQVRNFTETVDQIAFADTIFLTKTDLVDDTKLALVKKTLFDINPFVDVKAIDVKSVAFDQVVGLDLFDRFTSGSELVEGDIDVMIARKEGKERLQHEHAHNHEDEHEHHHDHSHEHDGENEHHHEHSDVNAFTIIVDRPLVEQKFVYWLNMVTNIYGMDLLRYKGILNVEGFDRQVVLQGVNMAYSIDYGKEKVAENEPSKLVIIGKKLPEKVIRELFEETVVAV